MKKRKVNGQVGDILPTVITPAVVRADMKKVKAYIDKLSDEVREAGNSGNLTQEQAEFLADYPEWHKRYDAWYEENSNEWWWPGQVASTSAIADQNDAWRVEAEQRQAKLKALGFKSVAVSPGPSTGGPGAPGQKGGGFFTGMGVGGLAMLALVAYFLSQDGGGGRRRR